MSPTVAMIRDSKAEVEKPCTILAARRYLYLVLDPPMAVPTMSKRADTRKTGRFPNFLPNAATNGPMQPAARRL